MKKFFVSILAITSLVACTKEEIVKEQSPFEIKYEGAYVENVTRAAVDPSTTTATIAGFNAYGFMDEPSGIVFNAEDVTKVGGGWSYANTQYWMPGHTYYFAALAPMDSQNWKLTATGNNKLGAGVVEFTNVDGTEDLLYAATTVTTPDEITAQPDAVKFAFNHLLSKVKFTFTNGFRTDNMSVIVSDVKMTAPKSGSINLDVENWWDNNDDWQLNQETVELAFGDVEELLDGASAEVANERLTIPAAGSQEYKITFKVTVKVGDVIAIDNEERTATVSGVALEMGKAYNFQATLTHSNVLENETLYPITFEVVEVKEWVTERTDAQVKEAEFRASMQFGGEVTLTENIELTSPVIVPAGVNTILNLNGHSIINTTNSEVFGEGEGIIAYGKLTIKGEGTIEGSTMAVWARGENNAEINIYGGNYYGCKEGFAKGGRSVIYASSNNTINIYGGTFEALAVDKTSFANKVEGVYPVLNIADNKGYINVYGGTFVKQNPALPGTEPKAWNEAHPNGFVAEGYYSNQDGDNYVVADAFVVATAEQLQAALNANNATIKFANDITGNVTIDQKEGVNYTIDGANYKFTGTMNINGHSRFEGEETLTIKNVHFYTEQTSAMDFIWSADSQNSTVRYAHNVTFDGCTFEAPEGTDVVGMRFNQAYDVVVKNCVVKGGHSLAQITSSSNTVFEGCTINAGRGINLLTSCVGLKVINCNITATKADGYGIRCDANTGSSLTATGCTIKAFEPIVLRNAKAGFEFSIASTILTATGDYQIVVAGETPAMNGASSYIIKK